MVWLFFSFNSLNLSGGQDVIKWVKSMQEIQYFEKKSDTKWVEYKNGRIFAEFTQISFQYPIVVLKKDDGAFVKLTESSGYLGYSQNNISNHFIDGKWEKLRKKN